MRASVNGEKRGVSLDGVRTIGDLVEQLEVHVPPRDVVVGLSINGIACDGDPAAQVRALPVVGVTDIDLQTRSPEAFAGEARDRVDDYLEAIRGRFSRAVEEFDRGLPDDALGSYRLGVEQLGLLVHLCERLARLGERDTGVDAGVASDLHGICARLHGVQERRDLSALREVLAEQLLPLLARWQTAGVSGA